MNFFRFIHQTMKTPLPYGEFHIVSVIAMVLLTWALCLFFGKVKDGGFRLIIFIIWLGFVVLEIVKELIFSSTVTDTGVVWEYNWSIFPFQFCSTPFYVLPMIFLFEKSRFRDACCAYISTFALFGGLVVFVYPNDVFMKYTLINVQTMVHHGLQIVAGVYVAYYYRKRLSPKFYRSSIKIFALVFVTAIVLNEIAHLVLPHEAEFNMFYISRFHAMHLPVLDVVYRSVPTVVFWLAYALGFTLVSYILYLIERLLFRKRRFYEVFERINA